MVYRSAHRKVGCSFETMLRLELRSRRAGFDMRMEHASLRANMTEEAFIHTLKQLLESEYCAKVPASSRVRANNPLLPDNVANRIALSGSDN